MQNKYFYWLVRIVPAIIMLQTLFFKFSAAPESVYIFSQLGAEPYGRIGTGVSELIASLLILMPRTTGFGAGLGAGLMGGAIMSHLTMLGIAVQDDGGKLFGMAVITLLCALIVLWQEREKLIKLVPYAGV